MAAPVSGSPVVGGIAAIGEEVRVAGFALAGAAIFAAGTPDAVRAAWAGLGDHVVLVVLTPSAAAALGDRLDVPASRLTAVLPA